MKTPTFWPQVPWRIVHTLRRAGLRPEPCADRPGAAFIPAQRVKALGLVAVRGVLYWQPRWASDGPALYLDRADHWDRAANADVVIPAVGLTVPAWWMRCARLCVGQRSRTWQC